MTDWQQPLVVALTKAEGVSIVHETVYENRFGFTDALVEMGANIAGAHGRASAATPCRVRPAQLRAGRRHHRADASCTAPTSACPTCAAASATSSPP